MFAGFANVWTIVGLARDPMRDKPLAICVAGARVVRCRDGDGRPAALRDVCPQRGVAFATFPSTPAPSAALARGRLKTCRICRLCTAA